MTDMVFEICETFDRTSWTGDFTRLVVGPGGGEGCSAWIDDLFGFDPATKLVFPCGLCVTDGLPWIAG